MVKQSTTQRLTNDTLLLIMRYSTAMNAGVIVRNKGKDIGVNAVDIQVSPTGKATIRGIDQANNLTIPKTTIASMNNDLNVVTRWDNLSRREQLKIQNQIKRTGVDAANW